MDDEPSQELETVRELREIRTLVEAADNIVSKIARMLPPHEDWLTWRLRASSRSLEEVKKEVCKLANAVTIYMWQDRDAHYRTVVDIQTKRVLRVESIHNDAIGHHMFDPAQIVGKQIIDFLPPDVLGPFNDALERAVKVGVANWNLVGDSIAGKPFRYRFKSQIVDKELHLYVRYEPLIERMEDRRRRQQSKNCRQG